MSELLRMATPPLATKLHFPQVRPNLVSRPRLVAILEKGLSGSLTLISAQAGSGKTTIMGDWRVNAKSRVPVAWLSLDSADNDPLRFLTYLIASIESASPDLTRSTVDLLQSPQLPALEIIASSMIESLNFVPNDLILALDDYHVITNVIIHDLLNQLLAHLPPTLHLVILTRADPPLPLARLRVQNALTEIRAHDLRFTMDEVAAFLSQTMGLSLSGEQVASLEARTEGWIAGLQLAALSIQGRGDVDDFIAAFTGSHRYVVDYLIEEVLNRQPENIRDFLLQTSILERLNGEICNALTRQIDGQAILEQLDRANIFLIPLDQERCWYRYHHLFADMLQKRLHDDPGRELELHRCASRWYEQNGWLDYAIEHALQAEEWPRAVSLMEQASQAAALHGEVYKIKTWVERLPRDSQSVSPRLSIHLGWATVLSGQFEEAESILAQLEPALENSPSLRLNWLAAKVWAARGRGEQAKAVELALEALNLPTNEDLVSRCSLYMSLSIAYWHLGNLEETLASAKQGIPLAERTGDWNTWVILMSRIALVKAAQGHLKEAERLYLGIWEKNPNMPRWAGGGLAHFYLSALYYEWNDLDRALEYACLSTELSQNTRFTESCINSYRQQAYIYQAQGNAEKAFAALDRAAEIARLRNLPNTLWGPLNASRLQIALCQGNLEYASQMLSQVQGGYGGAVHYLKLPLEPAKVALAQGNRRAAEALLAAAWEEADRNGIGYARIEILILRALAAGNEDQALKLLYQALILAQPEGYVRVFVDQGKCLIPLLRKAAQSGMTPIYTAKLLAAFSPVSPREQTKIVDIHREGAVFIPLSAREIEVLLLITAGCSNKEIAARLVISIGTVKRHTVNIFNKLGVKNRTEAVARARELGLL